MNIDKRHILETLEGALARLHAHKGHSAPLDGWALKSATELGLDSLDLAELLLELELELGLAVSGEALVRAPTLDALAALLVAEDRAR